MKNRYLFLMLIAVLLATLALSACTQENATDTTTAATTTTPTAASPYTAEELAEANALLDQVIDCQLNAENPSDYLMYSSHSLYISNLEKSCPALNELTAHKCFLPVVNERYHQYEYGTKKDLKEEITHFISYSLLYVYDKDSRIDQ